MKQIHRDTVSRYTKTVNKDEQSAIKLAQAFSRRDKGRQPDRVAASEQGTILHRGCELTVIPYHVNIIGGAKANNE